jgi:mono-ADP-ribosyltransferase sirtuin 6
MLFALLLLVLPVHGMGCKPTGRFCEKAGCGGPLRDKTIDWHTALPEEEFGPAIEHHQRAELALCLGTSLRIRPAGNMSGNAQHE